MPPVYLVMLVSTILAVAEGVDTLTQANIATAVTAWFTSPTTATATYGPIGEWDTSAVTSMAQLFYNKPTFNSDISKWNVASVTTMSQRHAPWLCMHYAAT